MKRNFLITGFILLFAINLHAQQNEKAKAESDRLMKLYQTLEGTYQVQVIDSREKVGFPLATLDSIQAKRQQNTTVYLWLKNNIRVMVPPYSEIHKKEFVPLAQTAYFSSQNLPQVK